MTPQEINIEIAKANGWTEIQWAELTNPREASEWKQFCRDTERTKCLWIPNYYGSLDAIVPIIRVFTSAAAFHEIDKFYNELRAIRPHYTDIGLLASFPNQLCEAYLKAKNLWK